MKNVYWIPIGVAIFVALTAANDNEPEPMPTPVVTETDEVREVVIETFPKTIQQGEPVRITIENIGTSAVETLRVDNRALDTFSYGGKPTAVTGIDLNARTGTYNIQLELSDDRIIESSFEVRSRPKVEAPLGIPDNLGGNTPEAEQELLRTLAQENTIINSVPTERRILWNGDFIFPVKNPVVTDEYGYSRLTGASTISHKGTDFRAAIGTPVYAMNSGIVRIAREFRNYGNTVVVDHGFGIQTFYMHLSEMLVEQGDTVNKGGLIAKSGKTGYSEFPHLHITVKVGSISIDPMKFLEIF